MITDYAREQLSKSLQRFGNVELLVWNEATGTLVSGHQRLKELDSDEGYPDKCADYIVPVSVVKLSVKEEKILNVLLNNKAAQGNFDEQMFAEYLRGEPTLTLADIGFTNVDVEFEFGTAHVFDALEEREEKATEPVRQSVEEIKAAKKAGKAREREKPAADADYFLLIPFDSAKEKESWLRQHGFPITQRYVNIREMELAISGKPLEVKPAEPGTGPGAPA